MDEMCGTLAVLLLLLRCRRARADSMVVSPGLQL